jgi:hypothetical protein
MFMGIDAQGGVDRGVQIGHADGAADDGHRQVVGLADRLAGFQAAAG